MYALRGVPCRRLNSMAEERIVAVDLKKQCAECRQVCEEYDGFYADCDQCPFAEKAIKRTEAIKRMARELCENVYGSFWENASEQEKQNSLIYAEAALDALLEVNRNE